MHDGAVLTNPCRQERDQNLMDQLQKLKTERKDIEEDIRQMVLMMEDRRAELTKQREGYEQVPLVFAELPLAGALC